MRAIMHILPPERAALAAAAACAGIALFQLVLAVGAPLGRAAWGGTISGRLPARFRAASVLAMLVWSFAALVVLARVGLGPMPPAAWTTWATWVLFGLLVLGALMNVASRSPWERYFWGPYALVLAGLALVVAGS
ncbi:hypothetical protein K7640_20935 [Micromonospora sp. PLK6-60]|uniref:hypothetical protein n=1 Tax=Micromonospora sp. PLK6-60 TaxID=2873383 RepID=UPI001CA6F37E|nr:hypothetical protein [Micromonospora sp. PLK6-60]MBY8874300.1 hypothetical protein [Micromonospora sp. PLK6-60]